MNPSQVLIAGVYIAVSCCSKAIEPYENSFPPLQPTSKVVKADSGADVQCASPAASDRSCAATPVMSWKDSDSVHSNESGQLDPYRLPFDMSEAKQQVCEDELLLEAARPWCTLAHVQQAARPMHPYYFMQPVQHTVHGEMLPQLQVYTRVSGPPPQHIQSLFSLPSIISC